MPGIASSYWNEFDQYLSQNSKILRCGNDDEHPTGTWANIRLNGKRHIGKAGFVLLAVTGERHRTVTGELQPYISVGIVVRPEVRKYFGLVHWGLQFDGTLDKNFGSVVNGTQDKNFESIVKWTLDLNDPDDPSGHGYIMVDWRGANPAEQDQWQTQYRWMCDTLHQLVDVFERRLAHL